MQLCFIVNATMVSFEFEILHVAMTPEQ